VVPRPQRRIHIIGVVFEAAARNEVVVDWHFSDLFLGYDEAQLVKVRLNFRFLLRFTILIFIRG
jgi:hypothetical protein